MERYAIYEENMERLKKKLNAIASKCAKYGCEFVFNEVGEEYRERTGDDGEKFNVRYVIVEAEGIARVNGWRFAATLEHTEKGNIIKKVDDSIEVPERYYSCEPVCEHCKTRRSRKDTFIVFNEETGEFKQVGKRCLCDFTNGLSAEAVARYLSWFDELVQGEEPYSGGYGPRYYETDDLLRYYAETIRKFGYVKAGEAESTRDRGFAFFLARERGNCLSEKRRRELNEEMDAVLFDPESVEVTQMVADALAWLKEQEPDGNYMHNLKTICSMEYVKGAHTGFLCSLFPTWNRELEKEEKRRREAESAAASEYVGEIGKRMKFKIADASCLTSWETMYGMTWLWKFVDEAGNVLIWKSSNWLDPEKKIVELTGTVKEHSEYGGVKQTVVTRCKVRCEEKEPKVGTFDLSVLDGLSDE